MRERKSKIAGEIIADMNKQKEYKEWLQRQKEEKQGKFDEKLENE